MTPLLPFPEEPKPIIRCPNCDYSPREEARYSKGKTDMPDTIEDQLDFFEVSGCDEGNVMCPVCAYEFGSECDCGESKMTYRTMEQMFDDLVKEGGAIVSSGDCSAGEITAAQGCHRFCVRDDGMGFVRRPKNWLHATSEIPDGWTIEQAVGQAWKPGMRQYGKFWVSCSPTRSWPMGLYLHPGGRIEFVKGCHWYETKEQAQQAIDDWRSIVGAPPVTAQELARDQAARKR